MTLRRKNKTTVKQLDLPTKINLGYKFLNKITFCATILTVAALGAVMSEIGIPRNRVMASKYVRHDEHGMRNTSDLPVFNLWSIIQRLTSSKNNYYLL